MSRRFTAAQVAEFTEALRRELPPGSTVSTKVLHVSRSGMSREIGAYIVRDGQIADISWEVAAIIGATLGNSGGVKLSGVGMDMGFHLVYSLSRRLYPQGHLCTGSTGVTPTGRKARAPRCPSNDHSNDWSRLAREYDAAHPEPQDAEIAASLAGDDDDARRIRSEYVSARQDWIAAQGPKLYSRTRVHSDGGYAITNRGL